MEKENEQTEVVFDTTETEKNQQVSLGKFKDVNDLLNAYNSLQAEFTKRCQRLKELEGTKIDDKAQTPSVDVGEKVDDNKNADMDKEQVLKEYLKNLIGSKPKAVVMDFAGAGVKTPLERPKTIVEAGNLAKNILNN